MPRRIADLHPEAIAEAREARLWYRERSLDAEERFRRELKRAIRAMQEAPETWPADEDGVRTCRLKVFPYSLLYALEGDACIIVAVAHAKRRPGYWRSRVK
jgi:plasmid stabilization system protein ParE